MRDRCAGRRFLHRSSRRAVRRAAGPPASARAGGGPSRPTDPGRCVDFGLDTLEVLRPPRPFALRTYLYALAPFALAPFAPCFGRRPSTAIVDVDHSERSWVAYRGSPHDGIWRRPRSDGSVRGSALRSRAPGDHTWSVFRSVLVPAAQLTASKHGTGSHRDWARQSTGSTGSPGTTRLRPGGRWSGDCLGGSGARIGFCLISGKFPRDFSGFASTLASRGANEGSTPGPPDI